jgi:hypothetical protein
MLVAQILALHELREVRSWRSAFQAMGPPERMTVAPLMLQNLKGGSWMPSWTALPSCDPQHASLYLVRRWCWSLDGGMASVYACDQWWGKGHEREKGSTFLRSKREAVINR